MKHHKFEGSTSIASVRHDSKEKVLTVSFHSGSSYDFVNVPNEIFHNMIKAESAGKFYHANVRGKFDEVK